MESFATPYPVIFYDGEQEHDKGFVGVHSVLSFKRFQALMSQKTGIPANQLSAVFVCRRTLKDTEKRQKLPINENTNFNIILNQHNPSRERDCHFLVSIKKSKKERKGTRKRSAEAENAEDDDSNSSRGDLSPSDERPKPGSGTEETFSPEATSPPVFMQRPSSPSVTHLASANGQRVGSGSPNGKSPSAASDCKGERTLLRREGMGQNGFASPRGGWQNGGGGLGQRVEGFSVPCAGKVESTHNMAAVQQEDRHKLDSKQWMQEGSDLARQLEKANGQAAAQQPHLQHQVPLVDLFLQERFNDAVPQGPGGVRTAPGVIRNGLVPSGVPPMVPRLPTYPTTPIARPSIASSAATANGNFLPRVSMVGLAGVAGQSGGLMLQQAQAHISHLQQLQPPVTMTPLELSKLSGVLRGLVARDNRTESQKICKLCCFCRERNIGPPPFHGCVDDTITTGFRGPSPAGPIGRPGKRHVEAAA